jgi:pimeloyl-ACP methyl ester carboxylesterase
MFSPDPPPAARDELGAIMADFHPLGFRLMATALAIANTREQLAAIRVPTLLVWGDADARSPITIADQFLEAIPNARLVVLRGAGHLSNLERPDEFTAAVREFLHAGT